MSTHQHCKLGRDWKHSFSVTAGLCPLIRALPLESKPKEKRPNKGLVKPLKGGAGTREAALALSDLSLCSAEGWCSGSRLLDIVLWTKQTLICWMKNKEAWHLILARWQALPVHSSGNTALPPTGFELVTIQGWAECSLLNSITPRGGPTGVGCRGHSLF